MKLQIGKKLRFYYVIYLVYILLSVFSIYAAFSLTGELLLPIIQSAIGFGFIYGVGKIRYQRINQWSGLGLIVALILLVITILFGKGGGGRSLRIGTVQFQTFYSATFLIVLYIATYLARKCERIKDKNQNISKSDTLYICIIVLLSVGLIALRNLSTAILLFCTSFIILFVARARKRDLAALLLFCVICGSLYLYIGDKKDNATVTEQVANNEEKAGTRGSTAMNRIKYWITGESETNDYGKQMTLAKAAIARSFAQPTGPGKGMMKRSMAEGDNDYVFALICEEISTASGLVIMFLYMILAYQSILIARKAKGNEAKGTQGYFIKIFSVSIGCMIFGQALIHIGANVGIIPATGQTLPFISKGLTTMLITCSMLGILVNMGKQVDEKTVERDDDLAI